MLYLLGGILFLAAGYFVYGTIVERIVSPDDRLTPCIANPDGVDYVHLPKLKNMLIQLLNIAGVGPVIGVILGIKFGKIALVIIPVGCVLLGAVHDYMAGMMSLRHNGDNLPNLVKKYLGKGYSMFFSWFMIVLLLLVVAVFINVPAKIIDLSYFPDVSVFWWAVVAIFAYYLVATLFPVDRIIGRVYPFFGAMLIVGTFAIFASLIVEGLKNPAIFSDVPAFAEYRKINPLFPCLFVTIACGIISGFHATQSPIVARTMGGEREAKPTFFGMMILEGVIAMIWAASALAIYNLVPENLSLAGPVVLNNIATHFLGNWMGGVTVLAVVVLAITSGDTALRSSRLSLAEMLSVRQVKISSRIATCVPLTVIVCGLLWWSNRDAKSFGFLWNYFAWGNQVISATVLLSATVWLMRNGRSLKALVAFLPGAFMTAVVSTFILWASPEKGQVWGFALSMPVALSVSALIVILCCIFVIRRSRQRI